MKRKKNTGRKLDMCVKKIITLLLLCTLFLLPKVSITGEKVVYSYAHLNIRSHPSVTKESVVLKMMNIGDSATILSNHKDWYKVLYDDTIGYISKSYSGLSYVNAPLLEHSFKENKLSHIISINSKNKSLAIIEDRGGCGAKEGADLFLIIYNYATGETIGNIHLKHISEISDAYYQSDYQKILFWSWKKECCLIQKTLSKYGFEKVLTKNDSILKAIVPDDLGYDVEIGSLTDALSSKWTGVKLVKHNNSKIWDSEEMVKKKQYPTTNFYFLLIDNETIMLGQEYYNDYDCIFYNRIILPNND